MRKPVKAAPGTSGAGPMQASAFALAYPVLCEWMSTEFWDDDSVRETTTLFLFATGGWLKCMLKDRAEGKVAFYTAGGLAELLEVIEGHLEAGTVDWKVDRPPAGRGRK